MTELNLQYLCINVIDIARLAGTKILEIYNKGFDIAHKEDKTPLTTADLAANDIIVSSLQELTPEIPILSEESEKIPFEIRRQWQRYWLVDPLDGTREFIKRNDEFSVNIALVENHQSILGVIYAPVMAIDYYAWRNGGAFKKRQGSQPKKIHVRNINQTELIVAGSRSHGSEKQQEYIAKLENASVIPMGSSLKSCLVAEGKADIYPRLGPTSEWDTAAAQCIVEEAGGYLINAETLEPLRYNLKDNLTNPHFLVYGDNSKDWCGLL